MAYPVGYQNNPSSGFSGSNTAIVTRSSSNQATPVYSGILPSGISYQVSIGSPSTTTIVTTNGLRSSRDGNQYQNLGANQYYGLSIDQLLSSGLTQEQIIQVLTMQSQLSKNTNTQTSFSQSRSPQEANSGNSVINSFNQTQQYSSTSNF